MNVAIDGNAIVLPMFKYRIYIKIVTIFCEPMSAIDPQSTICVNAG